MFFKLQGTFTQHKTKFPIYNKDEVLDIQMNLQSYLLLDVFLRILLVFAFPSLKDSDATRSAPTETEFLSGWDESLCG